MMVSPVVEPRGGISLLKLNFKNMPIEKCCLTWRFRGQLLGITQRSVHLSFDHSKERYSPRKLIPVNAKTAGDHILLKRIAANLSQPEVAARVGVSVRKVKAWEHDQVLPTEAQWQRLTAVLQLDAKFPKN
jgi:DNA-binding transcriptional regulator YiaG